MSLEQRDYETEAELLADLTGEPAETFTYDGEIPEIDELEFEYVDEE